jgi:protein phosphatase
MQSETPIGRSTITIPPRTLLVLCGPAGSGKSTLAHRLVKRNEAQGWRETMIVASDCCRAMICDDENSQLANRDAFELFHFIIHKRMEQQRLTISDSTALTFQARQGQLELARRHHYHACLLILDVPLELVIAQDGQRQRVVGPAVIEFHAGQLQQTLLSAPQEGWDQYHILRSPASQLEIIVSSEQG